MINALITGDLVADPVERKASNGSAFMTTTLRVPAGAEAVFIGLSIFTETGIERLSKLAKGASLAAVGVLEQNVWTDREGKERIGWRLTATEIMSVYTAAKRRERTEAAE